ncbi:MAG: alpha/beta fold hydrolase [Candidatus Rokubacteria bacterium]|nr:alpha/beta fold hydrolase [Candidatus Rokubacteria bacterium]
MPSATVGGLRMYYEWHGEAPGPPLVLVMGLGGDLTAWGLQLAAFAPACRCLVFDNRGAGRSDAPDAPYTIPGMAADLLGLLDALDIPRAHLLGVSMGGAIVQEAALAAPERVASLQLHCTWAGPDPFFRAVLESLVAIRRRLDGEALAAASLPWLFGPQTYAERPELIEGVRRRVLDPSWPQPLHAYLRQAEALRAHDARARLPGLRCPTLVTVGADDLVTPLRLARELIRLIPGARLEVIGGGGHGYFWEVPQAFNAACLAFLAAQKSA